MKPTYRCERSGFAFTATITDGLPKVMVEIPGRLDEVHYNELSFTQIRNLIPKPIARMIEKVMWEQRNRTPSVAR